jgi:hypothetical protein
LPQIQAGQSVADGGSSRKFTRRRDGRKGAIGNGRANGDYREEKRPKSPTLAKSARMGHPIAMEERVQLEIVELVATNF